jgi:hypothetical protein
MSSKKRLIILLGIVTALLAIALESKSQSHEGYIYGKVYTDRTTYTGPMRWGNEEVFWSDLFNAAKSNNDYAKLVPKEASDSEWWSNYNWSFSSIWEDKETAHQFTCQFGNLKEIIPISRSRIKVKLKNGGELQLNGDGYNDVESNIQLLDEELGTISVAWERVKRIEFLPTPVKLNQVFGTPLYGTVEGLRREKYTGFIIWDNDERLGSDKLDGDNDDGDVSIKFSDITSIAKSGSGCNVRLKSSRELYLTGSNDVNNGNRGVIVVTPDMGMIKFSWKAFKQLTFLQAPHSGQAYNTFTSPKPLVGSVTVLEGADVTGRIIYDVDEVLDFEIVEGNENDIEYSIPLKNIKKITPKNSDYSQLELISGQTLFLGNTRDVSEGNSGVLVFEKGKKDPVYIAWRKINEIIFQ